MAAVRHNPRRAFAWMLLGLLLTAAVAEIAHGLDESTHWTVVLLARTWGGALFALAWARAGGVQLTLRGPRALWVRTAAATVGLPCTFYAYSTLSPAEGMLIMSTAPLIVAVLSALYLGQRHRRAVWVAVVLGLAGIAIIARPHVLAGNLGALAALCTATALAVAMMAIARLRHVVDARAVVFHASAGSAVSATALALLFGQWQVELAALPALALVALLSTAGQLASVRALSGGSTPTLAAASYLIVPIGLAMDLVLWGTWPDAMTLAGMAIVLLPILWLVVRPRDVGLTRARNAVTATVAPDPDGLRRIEAAIARAERVTSCEFRVHLDRAASDPSERARALFDELGMSRTVRRNGVLLYVSLAGGVAIHCDEGTSGIVAARVLDEVCARLVADLSRAPLEVALEAALERLGEALAGSFPYPHDDVDELPNAVSISS